MVPWTLVNQPPNGLVSVIFAQSPVCPTLRRTQRPCYERPGSAVLITWPTTCVRPGGSSAFVVIVDARRPADTPFHRRRPRFPRGCGAHMEQLVEISHIVNFTGVLQTSVEDGIVRPKFSWSRQLCLRPHLTDTLFSLCVALAFWNCS